MNEPTPFLHTYRTQIRESHLDTFGHVNHAVYLELMEDARWDLITERGFGLEMVQQTGLGPTILELTISYRRELKNREQIRIETHCESYEGKIGVIVQRMFKEEATLCAEAQMKVGLFDTKARRLIKPTPEWRKAVGLPEEIS